MDNGIKFSIPLLNIEKFKEWEHLKEKLDAGLAAENGINVSIIGIEDAEKWEITKLLARNSLFSMPIIHNIPPPPITISEMEAIKRGIPLNDFDVAIKSIEKSEREKSLNKLMDFALQPLVLDSLEDLPKTKLSRRERRKMNRK